MRILVTGGSGFIGTNVCDVLMAAGHTVRNLDVLPPRNPQHSAIWSKVDLCDSAALTRATSDFAPDWLLHLGARTDLNGAAVSDYAANVQGVQNVIAAAKAQDGLQRVLFASSRLVCHINHVPTSDSDYCPTTPYGESKVLGEQIVRHECADAPWPWMIFRPTSIWGPWFGVPYKLFFDAVARGRYIHPQGRSILKSFGYVGNSVHQLLALAAADQRLVHGKTMYLADYPPIEVRQMSEEIRRAAGAPPVRDVPLPVLRAAAWAGDAGKALGWREPPLTSFRLDNLLTNMVYDTAPLAAVVGPLPVQMPEGVVRTVDWMKSQGLLP